MYVAKLAVLLAPDCDPAHLDARYRGAPQVQDARRWKQKNVALALGNLLSIYAGNNISARQA
jgi:hypothetical protein